MQLMVFFISSRLVSLHQNQAKSLNLTILFEVYPLIFDGNTESEQTSF